MPPKAPIRRLTRCGSVGSGEGHEVTIEQLARRILELTGSRSPIRYVPYEQAYEAGFEDMRRRVPDASKLFAYTGFRACISLDQTLREVIDYEKSEVRSQKSEVRRCRPQTFNIGS